MSTDAPGKPSGHGWSRTPAHAIANRSLTDGTLRILDAICIHVDPDGFCYPSQERIALIVGMRRETVCRAVGQLIRAGYLSRRWFDMPNGQRVRGYKVAYPKFVPPPSRYGQIVPARTLSGSDRAITLPVIDDADNDVTPQSP